MESKPPTTHSRLELETETKIAQETKNMIDATIKQLQELADESNSGVKRKSQDEKETTSNKKAKLVRTVCVASARM